jgi:hypothetical protein
MVNVLVGNLTSKVAELLNRRFQSKAFVDILKFSTVEESITFFSSSVRGFFRSSSFGGNDFSFREDFFISGVDFLSASFDVGMTAPKIGDGSYVALSGSALNFVPDPTLARG